MARIGLKGVSRDKCLEYLGGEIEAFLHRTQMFMRNCNFANLMERSRFQEIQANVRTYPFNDQDIAARNPIWNTEEVLEHFCKKYVSMYTPWHKELWGKTLYGVKGGHRFVFT